MKRVRLLRPRSKLLRAFLRFHAAHPEVYRMFRRFAVEMLEAGHPRGSSELIVNRIRWESAVNPSRDGGYKVCQNHKPYYARMLARRDPRFREFFEFRKVKGG